MPQNVGPTEVDRNNGAPTVLVWYTAQWVTMYPVLARVLREDFGVETVLLVYEPAHLPKPGTHDFDKSVFRDIEFLSDCLTPSIGADEFFDASFGQILEADLGVLLSDIMRTDRQLGIDFVTGAEFYRSRWSEGLTYDQKLDVVGRFCQRFQSLMQKHNVVGVFASPGSIGPAALSVVAQAMKIPFRHIVRSRFGNEYYWSDSWDVIPVGFDEAYHAYLDAAKLDTATVVDMDAEMKSQFDAARPARFDSFVASLKERSSLRNHITLLYRILRRDIGTRLYRRGMRHGHYDALSVAWNVTRVLLWRRRMLREPAEFKDRLPEYSYVYFPLSVEPESTLMVEAQASDTQLICVDWLAKNLPAGWRLVVKEHPGGTAPRPTGFWQRIRRYPNIVVAGTLGNSDQLAMSAKLVATINGSTGIQAALAGLPVLCFAEGCLPTRMPHVMVANSYRETGNAIQQILKGDLPSPLERHCAITAFKQALHECSFSIDDRGMLSQIPGSKAISRTNAERLAQSLMSTLSAPVLDNGIGSKSQVG